MKRHLCTMIFLFLVMLISLPSVYAQTNNKPFFTVEGEVLKPLKLTQEDLLKLKQTEVKAKDRDGKEHTFKGVLLVDILDSAGVTLGKDLRGENLTKYVLIKAVDGYEVIFSLPEVDPEFTGQTIILAYQVNGSPLPHGDGPFRIVAPNDKRPARWIRELSSIKVVFSKD
jgi:DMSO/TMAO reductase YedYZ molybdopterin-dependent catalytic subunit